MNTLNLRENIFPSLVEKFALTKQYINGKDYKSSDGQSKDNNT
jgi:hypothetical protein